MRWLLFTIAVATTLANECATYGCTGCLWTGRPACFSAWTEPQCLSYGSSEHIWCGNDAALPPTAARGATREFAGDDLGTTLAIAIAVPLGSAYLAVHNGGVSV